MPAACRALVLISGSGSNLQALIDVFSRDDAPLQICAVLSNKADAFGLTRARNAGIDTLVLDHKAYSSREAFDLAMIEAMDAYRPDLVILAGFMRILTPAFVEHYQGRLLNIHPSLLPRHKGLHTHQRALEEGDHEHGCSVHFVTAELDGGPLVARAAITINSDDNAETLAARVHEQEHLLYPLVARWFAEGRLCLTPDGLTLDGQALPATGKTLRNGDMH
ncbi:phosphoribosylglycinamide formyltransferase [Atopomonas sediminilitoris]|uniref:phosphoribosylglycinamide formyltransferase n=1 Tax=Atopomonas sediminilitoris TaxID=2919919 RepID=UPI001F4E2244|nr:phosphoribosylglycinamide formyltransferase [Atopomonas sediminilitoris]MCJ8169234.1 phosphoribosylglycinamide formyltransferase [Atopomonas sediminilitoris]